MTNRSHIILFLFLFFQPHCKKGRVCCPDELPAISDTGKNIFGCKVFDRVWVPFDKCGYMQTPCGEMMAMIINDHGVELNISVKREENGNSSTGFHISTPPGSKIHTTGNKIDSLMISYGRLQSYKNSNLNPGTDHFTISKLDTVNKILSGTFAMTLYHPFPDSVKITEGRFDFKFNACKCTK